jgi:hypothetical protein
VQQEPRPSQPSSPLAKMLHVPTSSEMKIDHSTLDEFRSELSKRRKVNEERRIAFEKPPKAETM